MARIVSIYRDSRERFEPVDMSLIRWLKMAEALAGLGHEVDIATGEPELARGPIAMGPRLRRVSLDGLRWDEYDVVKTVFHIGFDTLVRRGGLDHPFLVSNLGSVVGERELPGVYFYGEKRAWLFRIQERMAERGGVVSILTRPSMELWRRCHGEANPVVLVPGATDAKPPAAGPDPYPADGRRSCVYSGNIYNPVSQPEAHAVLVEKLNEVGRRLAGNGIRLYVVGCGETAGLRPEWVTHLGAVPHERSWDYLWHADAGLVVAFGEAMNHNESTKIYYYLRAGLPVVCEARYPNEELIRQARLGVIAPNGDLEGIAGAVAACVGREWDRGFAMDLMVREHTWSRRAAIYDELFRGAGLRNGGRRLPDKEIRSGS